MNEKGAALTIVLISAIIIALIAAYVLTISYNYTRQIDAVGIRRTMIYYRAQAGMVDANWRIRTNRIPPGSVGTFTDPAFNPPAYFIDIDTDAASAALNANSDVRVDIGAFNANGLRPIQSTGLDR